MRSSGMPGLAWTPDTADVDVKWMHSMFWCVRKSWIFREHEFPIVSLHGGQVNSLIMFDTGGYLGLPQDLYMNVLITGHHRSTFQVRSMVSKLKVPGQQKDLWVKQRSEEKD